MSFKFNFVSWLFMAAFLTVVTSFSYLAQAEKTAAPESAKVYFINLKDGDVIKGPVHIQFGLSGMGVAPAGTDKKNTGHHHLIINETIEGDELNEGIPSDEKHIHFGGGQTETSLSLKPGTYTLQLVLGDKNHIPHTPPIQSKVITVTVK